MPRTSATASAVIAPRALIYLRISKDATGEAAGVERQRADCLDYCQRRGWPLGEVFVDNDISASQYARRRRPAYARMLAFAEETSEPVVIVAWHLDRLWRQPRELEHLVELAESGRVQVATLYGDVDLTTGDGRFLARIMVGVAAKASDDTSRRVRRMKEAAAERGVPGGGVVAFGWEPGGMKVKKDEAKLIRDAAKRVLAGDSLTGIAKEWNEAGIKQAAGGKGWTATTVRTMLLSPRNAGLRVHRGAVVGDAAWPAIVDRATHERLVAALTDPSRRRRNPPRRGLLTGLVRCGRCGEVMVKDSSRGKPVLRCKAGPGRANCGRMMAAGDAVESFITEAVLDALDTPALLDAMRSGPDDTSELVDGLADDEASLEQLARDHYADRLIGRAEYLAARGALEERIEEKRSALNRGGTAEALLALDASTPLRERWPELSTDRKRAVIAAVIESVTVNAGKPGRGFDPARLDIAWKA